MLVPLYGFLAGDTLGMIVLVHDHQPVSAIVACLQQAAAPRVAPLPEARVLVAGRCLDPDLSIAQSGLAPLMRVDVVPR